MRKFLERILKVLGGLTLAVMFILVIWQVFTRYVLNNSATWTEELTSYLFAWLTLFGAALVTGEREHMNIPVFIETRSEKTQRIVAILSEIIILLFSMIVLVYGGIAISKLTMGQMTSSLSVPLGIFYMALPVAGALNILFCILNIKDIMEEKIRFKQKKSLTEASEELVSGAEDVSKHINGGEN
ncbi:MAG: TRAP transporter small permease [Peptoniphilaceae bacterium]|nr:TRAP transporter small permease [Peptoniphilaceae bacterium]MDY6019161.1 TRAP transporter small permease [Anaerococcus sp.]